MARLFRRAFIHSAASGASSGPRGAIALPDEGTAGARPRARRGLIDRARSPGAPLLRCTPAPGSRTAPGNGRNPARSECSAEPRARHRKDEIVHRTIALASLVMVVGTSCASRPDLAPLNASPVTAGSGERVIVDHAYLVIDSSQSVDQEFAREKALVESFVGAMPNGTYQTGSVADRRAHV